MTGPGTSLSRLRARLATFAPTLTPGPELRRRREAAVALLLRPAAASREGPGSAPDAEILLVRRSEMDGDPWSGHMAFPGGKQDPQDPDSRAAAIRETLEETGLDLRAHGEHLCRLSDVAPASPQLPPLVIRPHVFLISREARSRPNPAEIDELHWVPLDQLRDPESHGHVTIEFGAFSKDFPAIRVNDRVVWGLTHRIVTEFLEILG